MAKTTDSPKTNRKTRPAKKPNFLSPILRERKKRNTAKSSKAKAAIEHHAHWSPESDALAFCHPLTIND